MNIRMPKRMSEEVIKVQDEYLSCRAEEKGIVKLTNIPVIKGNLSIWQGDITRLEVDSIVNAANSQMLGCFVPMQLMPGTIWANKKIFARPEGCLAAMIHSFDGHPVVER